MHGVPFIVSLNTEALRYRSLLSAGTWPSRWRAEGHHKRGRGTPQTGQRSKLYKVRDTTNGTKGHHKRVIRTPQTGQRDTTNETTNEVLQGKGHHKRDRGTPQTGQRTKFYKVRDTTNGTEGHHTTNETPKEALQGKRHHKRDTGAPQTRQRTKLYKVRVIKKYLYFSVERQIYRSVITGGRIRNT